MRSVIKQDTGRTGGLLTIKLNAMGNFSKITVGIDAISYQAVLKTGAENSNMHGGGGWTL